MSQSHLCPLCHQSLHRPGRFRRAWSAYTGWKQSRMVTYQNNALTPFRPGQDEPWQPAHTHTPDAGPPGRYLEAERKTPYRPQNAESDFVVPLLQALGTGLFVTGGAGWAAWRYSGFTWEMASGLGIIAAGGFWLLTVLANRKLLWVVESVVNSDLDDDSPAVQPAAPSRPIALEITHLSATNSFQRMFRFDLPAGVTEADFTEFARGVVNEYRGLTEASWTGAGKLFSKPKYTALLEVLEQGGLVRWKNPTAPAQGRELTPAGGRALRMYLQMARTHGHAPNGGSDYEFIEGVG